MWKFYEYSLINIFSLFGKYICQDLHPSQIGYNVVSKKQLLLKLCIYYCRITNYVSFHNMLSNIIIRNFHNQISVTFLT